MDFVTFIKKEEPVEFALTSDDQVNVTEQEKPREITEIICSSHEFLKLGNVYTKSSLSKTKEYSCQRRFKYLFGVSPITCSIIWKELQNDLPEGALPKHLLWCLSFFKDYSPETSRQSTLKADAKTVRKWTWIFVELISKLKVEKYTPIIKQEVINWSGSENGYANDDKAVERNLRAGRYLKIFKCDICNAAYKSVRTLHKHKQNHNRQDKVQCKTCKLFCYTAAWPLHIQIHSGPPYNCPICLKKFVMMHSWRQHCRIMHREKKFKCEKCQRSFLQKHALLDHMQTHEERGKKFTCQECGACFCREESLTNHLKKQHSHIPQQQYRCSNTSCNKTFRTNRFFQSHVCRRKKDSEKPPKKTRCFTCTTCHKDIYTRKAFRDHQQLHRRERSTTFLTCPKCPSKFLTKNCLKDHLNLHRRDRRELMRKRKNMHAKRRNCEKCNRNFKITDASYQLHLAQNCPDKVTYECDNCSRLFSGKFAILAHLSQAHKSKFECDICGSAFMRKDDIVEHILLVHSPKCFEEDAKGAFTCLRCSNNFVDVDLYLEHMQQGSCAYKFKCTFCDNRYPSSKALERHSLLHFKVYECAHCGKTYHSKNSLKMHMKRGEHRTNFVCTYCHKVFLNKGSRNTHTWYHCPKNAGIFECDICQSKFTKKADIVKHMWVSHSPKVFKANDNGTYTCGRCKGEFVGEKFFLTHVQLRNCAKKVKCEICKKRLPRSRFEGHDCGQRNGENRAHKCTLCDSAFKTIYTLQMHMRRGEHRTSFECDYCHKVFQGKGSYMSHYKNFCRKNRPPERNPELPTNFECKSCARKFDNLGSYLTHCKYFCKVNQAHESDNESVTVIAKLPIVSMYKNLYGDY